MEPFSLSAVSNFLSNRGFKPDFDFEDDRVRLILAVSCFAVLVFLSSRLFLTKKSSLPKLPWVGRNEKAWFFRNTRARVWCLVHYEAALKKGYEDVSSPRFRFCLSLLRLVTVLA